MYPMVANNYTDRITPKQESIVPEIPRKTPMNSPPDNMVISKIDQGPRSINTNTIQYRQIRRHIVYRRAS